MPPECQANNCDAQNHSRGQLEKIIVAHLEPPVRNIMLETFSSLYVNASGLNNKVLQMFSTVFENFHHAAGELMDKIRTVLPEGSTKCRIRTSAREMHQPTTSTLLETLGEESTGMVFLDPVGVPMKYDQMLIYKGECFSYRFC